MLDIYLEGSEVKRKNTKPIINGIFIDKGNIYNINRLYQIMINIIFNYNYLGKNKENNDLIKARLKSLLIKIQDDITEIINKSLFELVDFFYFKFLRYIYVENDINDKYVIDTIILIMKKIIKRFDENNIDKIIEIIK